MKRSVRIRGVCVPDGLLIGLVLLMCLGCRVLRADESPRLLTGFVHTAWTAKTGAPREIASLAQTTDGMLWMGGAAGLFHFDGLRFVQFRGEPQGRLDLDFVQGLYAPATGGLWIGLTFGGAVFLKDGSVVEYLPGEELPEGSVYAFAQERGGAVWAATNGGVARFEGGHWQRVGAEWGLPPGIAWDVLIDASGTVWAGFRDGGLYFLPPGLHRFTKEPHDVSLTYGGRGIMAESPDGALWVTDFGKGAHPVGGSRSLAMRVTPLMFDRDGALWYGAGEGVSRLMNPRAFAQESAAPVIERFDRGEGFSNDTVNVLIEDRERNIWVGTQDGLNQFTRTSFRIVRRQAEGILFALVKARDGTIWWAEDRSFAEKARIVQFLDDGAVERLAAPLITCAYADEDGTLWFAGLDGVWRFDGEQLHALPPLHADAGKLETQALVRARDGALWRSVVRQGVFRFAHGEWQLNGGLAGLPPEPAIVMSADSRGRLWFGYTKNRVALLDGDSVRMLGAADGLDVGNVTAVGTRGEDVWVGGQKGLMRFDGVRFVAVRVAGENPYRSIWGVVETATGELWTAGASTLVRLTRRQLEEVRAGRVPAEPPQVFDHSDGLTGPVQSLRPLPALVESGDGRIWFALANGIGFIDPARLARDTPPPPVAVSALSAGDHEYSPFARDIRLPVSTTQLRISYTAPSFVAPERLRFRYRLDGLDTEWQEVGDRREAVYTNLGPRAYRFHVMVAHGAGPWSAAPASIAFTIPPAFYQTVWFYALCAVVAIVLLALLYRLRMHQATAAVRARLEERIVERERIARDLHDTLLQGVQGLILRFQAVSARIPKHEPARDMMERALTRADDVLIESRNRVKDLRSSTEMLGDLPAAMAAFGRQLAQEHGTEFAMAVEGVPRDLHPILREEAFMIGREALLNAFRHSGARKIEVEIAFGSAELRLRVRDDGRGVEPEVLAAGGRSGHWGLSGMRERAKKVHSQLEIWSRPGVGTEVELRTPAAVAYRDAGPDNRWRWLSGVLPRRARASSPDADRREQLQGRV